MRLKYIVFLLSLSITQLHSAENPSLGMAIYAANYRNFLTFFQNNNNNVNATHNGSPMLHVALEAYAAIKEQIPIAEKQLAPVSKMIIFLLENKNLLINKTDPAGNTALHIAVQQGLSDIVPLLLSHGAKVNARNKEGNTPLHEAIVSSKPDIVTLLLKNGAHVDIKNLQGLTPYHLLLERLDSLNSTKTLLEHSNDLKEKKERLTTIRDILKSVNPYRLQQNIEKLKPTEDVCITFK